MARSRHSPTANPRTATLGFGLAGSMSLLGRGRSVRLWTASRPASPTGASQVLVLRGDPGAGKSALLDYLQDQLQDWRVLSASGVESETELAYSGLHQLCAPLLEQHLDRLPAPQRDALATAFGLASRSAAGPVPRRARHPFPDGRRRRAAARRLPDRRRAVARPAPPPRSSPSSRGDCWPSRSRWCVRPVTGPEDDVLAGLPELPVHGLSDPDARALLLSSVHGPMDSAVVDQIVTESHGNPLALLELPRTWQESDLAGGFGLPDTPRPHTRSSEATSAASPSSRLRPSCSPWPPRRSRWATRSCCPGPPTCSAPTSPWPIPPSTPACSRSATGSASRTRWPARPPTTAPAPTIATASTTPWPQPPTRETDPDRRAWHLARATVGPDEDVAAELERSAGRAQARGGLAAAAAFLTRAMELTPDLGDRSRRALDAAFANVQAGPFDTARRLLAIGRPRSGRGRTTRHERAPGCPAGPRGQPRQRRRGPLLAAARRLESLDVDLARETYLDAFTASLFGARLNETVDAARRGGSGRGRAPRREPATRAQSTCCSTRSPSSPVTTSRPSRCAGPRCDRLHADSTRRRPELRWFWHGTVLALELWDDQLAYRLSEHHTQVARQHRRAESAGAGAELTHPGAGVPW